MTHNKQAQIRLQDKQIIISARKTPLFIRVVLTLLLLIFTLIPIAVTVFALTFGNGPHIGIVFSYIFCWGIGFYLLRIVLWNSIGQEILILNPDKIIYIADYRLFKDESKELETKDLTSEIIYEDEPDKSLGRLRLISKTGSLVTVLQATIIELEALKNEIQMRYEP